MQANELRGFPRHEADVLSLVAGLLFLGLSAAYALGSLVGGIDGRWVAPVLLVTAGVAGLFAARPRRRGRNPVD